MSPFPQPRASTSCILTTNRISNSDDEEWFYEGGWEDEDKVEQEGLSDDEDSNGMHSYSLYTYLFGFLTLGACSRGLSH